MKFRHPPITHKQLRVEGRTIEHLGMGRMLGIVFFHFVDGTNVRPLKEIKTL